MLPVLFNFILVQATTLVTVLMDDVASIYDVSPVFEKGFYIFDLDENQIVERLGKVEAHHKAADSRKTNDRLWYVLNRHSVDAALFRIDPDNGWLRNRVPFDAETQKRYSIQVSACLETNTTSCGIADVVIIVRDINDNPPLFNKTFYSMEIPLNLPADTELIRLVATDADSGPNAEVEYSIRVPGSFYDLFEINSNTGAISLAKRLGTNQENVAEGLQYQIDVDVQDHGSPSNSSSTSVLFRTAAINPSSPVFEKFRYAVTFNSPIAKDTEIVQVHATDPDPGLDGQVLYRFADLDQQTNAKVSKQFAIDANTGKIVTVTQVDPPLSQLGPSELNDANATDTYESTIQLIVDAVDQSQQFPRKSQTVVVIYLKPPTHQMLDKIEFIPLPNTIFISYTKPIGANVLKVSVRTKDGKTLPTFNRIEYEVLSENQQFDYFAMSSNHLIVKKALEPSEFDIQLRAKLFNSLGDDSVEVDHAMHVIVMKNRDKYPVFERLSYEIQVDSNTQFPIKIPSLNATLSNGRIEYSIYSSKGNSSLVDHIVVDKITGEFTIFEEFLNMIENDNPETHLIEQFFVIRAKNMNFPKFFSDVSIRLEIVNRHSPQFAFKSQLYRFEVRENFPIGSVINQTPPPSQIFEILSNGSVISMKSIDLEELASNSVVDFNNIINLNVVAENGNLSANSKVQIAIVDENEYTPKFQQSEYIFKIHSPLNLNTVVGQVEANDHDLTDQFQKLRYQAISGNALDYVKVTDDGKIVKNSQNQFESGKTYELAIEAIDFGGQRASVIAKFVSEEIEQPSEFLNSKIQFIDESDSGVIFVDLSPLNSSASIYQVKAINIDNKSSKIVYSIVNENQNKQSELFKIDAETGKIYVDYKKLLNETTEMRKEFHLLTEARDNVNEMINQKSFIISVFDGNAEVTGSTRGIELQQSTTNDDDDDEFTSQTISSTIIQFQSTTTTTQLPPEQIAPEFQSKNFVFVVKNPRKDQLVGHLPLRNEMSKNFNGRPVQMFIQPQEFRNWFIIDPRTSLLFIRQVPSNLTGRQRAEFHVVVNDAVNSELRSVANVKVDLILPTFESISVPPPAPTANQQLPNTIVDQQFSTDDDVQHIFDKHESKVTKSKTSKPTTDFTTSKPSNKNVVNVVTVSDENHRIAVTTNFDEPLDVTTSASLREEVKMTTVTFAMKKLENNYIVDRKAKPNSVTSPIVATTPGVIEEMEEGEGEDEEEEEEKLTIDSNNNNDLNQLRFRHSLYNAVLSEGNYGKRGALVTLRPEPLRQGMPDGVTYFMESEDPTLPFYIRNDTGELIAFAEIDREFADHYQIKVNVLAKGTNGSENILRAETKIEIKILDVNDNFPVFVDSENLPRVVAIDTLTPVGTILAQFMATDADEGSLGRVTYRIEENFEKLFSIGAQTGELVLTRVLPTDMTQDSFNIAIGALDGGRPALKTLHHVRIEVFTDSLEQPVFKQKEYKANISAQTSGSLTNGTFVAQVLAGTSKYSYNFIDQSSDLFKIDNNGIIRLSRPPMEVELNRNYLLNVSASSTEESVKEIATAMVSIFVDGWKPTTVPPPTTTTTPAPLSSAELEEIYKAKRCDFQTKIFNAEVRENLPGRHLLTQLKSRNCENKTGVRYIIHQGKTDEFELDEKTGEFYAMKPLDREKKSLHFIVVNITSDDDSSIDNTRLKRQLKTSAVNPIVEFAKNKLVDLQSLVVVRVIDENDNAPTFIRLNSDGIYVFVADWQMPLLQPIARINAIDSDLSAQNTLNYSLRSVKSDYFSINSTSGVVSLQKSLLGTTDDVFNMEVAVSDGLHETRVPMKIYKLELGVNVIIISVNQPVEDIDERIIERELSQALNLDVSVLVKQVFVGDEGRVDLQKSHLVVYAQEKLTRVPVAGEQLKKLLDENLPTVKNTSIALAHLSNITLPPVASTLQLSLFELIFFVFSILLMILSCFFIFLLLKYCKKRKVKKVDMEYMVGSNTAGPRPYNVELLTRKMAQTILASRTLPDSCEEVTLTPESRATMVASSGIYNNSSHIGGISANPYSSAADRANSRVESTESNHRAHHNPNFENSSSESLCPTNNAISAKRGNKTRPIPSITIGSTMA